MLRVPYSSVLLTGFPQPKWLAKDVKGWALTVFIKSALPDGKARGSISTCTRNPFPSRAFYG